MKKLLIIALVLLPSIAFAGDISGPAAITKAIAAPANPCTVATATTPLSCSGLYVGGGLAGAGGNADIVGNGINGSVFAGGIAPTLDFGYQYAKGNWFFAAEFDAQYEIGSNATLNGINSNSNGFRATEFFKVGGNLSGLLGTQTPITIPPALAAAVIAPYVGVGPSQWFIGSQYVSGVTSGAGVVFDIGPQWFGDLRYTYTNFNGAAANGVALQNDQSLMVTFNYKLK